MSLHVPFRAFNRTQKVRVSGERLTPTTSVYLNVDSPRVQRDIARHSAVGACHRTGNALGFTSDGYLQDGVAVSAVAGSLNLAVTAGTVVRANGNAVAVTAITGTPAVVGAAGATGPRIDVVCVNTASGAITVEQGTAAGIANANLHNRLSMVADLPANRVPVALVLVPTSAANLDTATILPLR